MLIKEKCVRIEHANMEPELGSAAQLAAKAVREARAGAHNSGNIDLCVVLVTVTPSRIIFIDNDVHRLRVIGCA